VVDAAVQAVGALAGALAWPQYEQLLNRWVKAMRGRPVKAVIRTVRRARRRSAPCPYPGELM
jgi:U3 small nucleolar RNA-associated protein 20